MATTGRSRSGLWAALAVVLVLIVVVLVFTQVRPDRHDDLGDTWITTQVQARLFADTGVRGREIDAVTRDGVVTLTGEVEGEHERERALALAREIDGVRQVVDGLQIRREPATDVRRDDLRREEAATPGEPPPAEEREDRAAVERLEDGWITTQIQAQYFVDGDVRGRAIDVTTRDQVVTLAGEVRSEAERDRALQIARGTDGVRDVTDRLRVAGTEPTTGEEPPGEDPEPRDDPDRDVTDRVEDGWITTQIQARYFVDADIRGREIDVTTVDGVVTLMGEVHSEAERQRAVGIARGINGVRQVDDRLTVRPPAEPGSGAGRRDNG
jgi:hyperosmotically inducible periplasmic protein